MKRKKTIKVFINKIEYLKKDRQIILKFINEFKFINIMPKKNGLKRRDIPMFIKSANKTADDLLHMLENGNKAVSEGISIHIGRLFYKYWNTKRRFKNYRYFDSELEKKLDMLADYAATIECGKLFKIRKKLINPECFKIDFFLKKSNAHTVYFNNGINQLININDYAYTLDMIESLVSRNFTVSDIKHSKKRMFYIHCGKTNSGKTYSSLQMLKNAKRGAYLSPLRLLALEISDTLNSQGVPCSFVTGEEEKYIENAAHISSTVELADFGSEYDVVVIDECQMISDYSRGYAWTKAIMNMKAKEICLCTAPEALDVLIKLIDNCGDYYEIINHRRETPLLVEDKAFSLDDVKQGDALVAFSKQKVNAIGAQLIKKGVNVSVLYGALPYSARKQQFENFIEGKSSVLVTTDAIGMGVNLPVRRIVFMESYKFDGETSRLLSSGEIKQIAGRAGRRGKFDVGYVNANGEKELEFIRKMLFSKTENVKGICVNFPKQILNDKYITLKNAITCWNIYDVPEFYIKESLNEAEDVLEKVMNIYDNMGAEKNKLEIFETASMPVDNHNISVRRLWLDYIEQRLSGVDELRKPYLRRKTVDEFLNYSKMLDTYFMCSKIWNMKIDFQWLERKRQMCNEALIDGLIDDVKRHTKYCISCGKILDWNNFDRYCEDCRIE